MVSEGGKVSKYCSSAEPLARDSGMRCTRMLVVLTLESVVRSQMEKQSCVMPEAGWKGVLYVSRVIGRSASEVMLKRRVGGMGLEYE